jgi:hypothetical protein
METKRSSRERRKKQSKNELPSKETIAKGDEKTESTKL